MKNAMIIHSKKVSRILSFMLMFLSGITFGQQTDNWYFGSPTLPGGGLRIDFSSGSPVVTRGYPLVTEEGSSSISDINGNPLFYTDGTQVWDASTNTTFGPALLGGSSSTQSAIVMPRPGATNEWLIFTSGQTAGPSGTNGIHYYVVSGTPGAFTVPVGPVSLAGTNVVGEGLFIIGSTRPGSAFWVIARDNGSTGVVRAWDVSNLGVVNTTPVTSTLSNTGWTQTAYNSNIGTVKSNTCQNQLAFTYLSGDVDLTGFDTYDGIVIPNTARRINVASSGGNSGSYGIEFSPNDAYLYITNLAGNRLYRHNIAANTTVSYGTTSYEAGQLQLGPDGRIYMAIVGDGHHGNGYLGVISDPGNAGAVFTANGLLITTNANPEGFSYRGLPTFPKSLVVSTPTLNPGDGTYCTGVGIPLSYSFAGSDVSRVWSITPASGWSFTSGSSTSANPTVTFTASGNYTVSVDITDICGRHYIQSMVFNITTPLIPAGVITCANGEITLTATGTDPLLYPNYTWYDASSGGNILGVGSPVTLNYGDNINAPAAVWVEVAANTSTPASGTNQSIGMAASGLSWAANGSPYGPVPFTVLSDVLTLRSFMVRAWTGGGSNFDVVIRNSSNVILFQQTFSIPSSGSGGSPFTVDVNTSFPAGSYTITLNNTSAQWYGGSWGGQTNPGEISLPTFGGAGTYALANLIYDYKDFSVVSTCSQRVQVDRSCTLPVRMLAFTGEENNGAVFLNWATLQEVNNDYFEIQRSSDGIHFGSIGKVKGYGNSEALINYAHVDQNPVSGISYYRLKQVDYDGTASYTGSIKIYTDNGNAPFVVSPNPSAGAFNISFSDLSGGELILFDVLGKVVLTQSIEAGTENVLIGEQLVSGAYLLKISGVSGSSTQLIIKE